MRELLEVNLDTGELRWLMNGDSAFSGTEVNRAKVIVAATTEDKDQLTQGLVHDSHVSLLVPAYDLDSQEIFSLKIDFYVGDEPLVFLEIGDGPLPNGVLTYVLEKIDELLREADVRSRDYLNLADTAKNIGRWALESRTRRIEQSVREALDDEEVSAHDYSALRRYADRLAYVEIGVGRLRKDEPTVTSHEPRGPYSRVTSSVDFYFKWLEEAGADARNAVGRLSGLISSQQIVLTQRQAAETARFQRLVTIVGAAILVPGLVAGIFGANVGFRGRESAQAFWAMLCLMVGSGIGSYALIRLHEADVWNSSLGRKVKVLARVTSDRARLGLLSAVAVLVIGIGLWLFLGSQSQESAAPTASPDSSSTGGPSSATGPAAGR